MHHEVLQSRRRRALFASGLTACAAMIPGLAQASHHFEVAAVRNNPKLGLTDMYVFNTPDRDRTVFILNANFLPKPGEDLLDRNGLYNIHCATDDKFKAGFTWTFAFDGTHVTVGQLDEPNGEVGARGKQIGQFALATTTELKGGIRAWVGHIKDPFYGNSPGLNGFRGQIAQGRYNPDVWVKSSGKSIFEGRTCGCLVLEVPNTLLGSDIQAFSTAAVEQGGKWLQVQYMAKPLISHTMLFEDEPLKAAYDASRPDRQHEFINFFSARTARAAYAAKSRPDPFAYGDEVAKRLLPDVMSYKVGTEAKYAADVANGRNLDDDAMSVTLTWLIGQPTDQKVKNPRLYTQKFPFIVPA